MKNSLFGKRILISVVIVLLIVIAVFLFLLSRTQQLLAVGTANPGHILLFQKQYGQWKKIRDINTGYSFVYTVRIGDVFNTRKRYLIAGVSNSFFKKPFGCKIMGYDMERFKAFLIDDVGDLRCKDLTIGDADNDGKNEIILGTQGEGIIRLYKWDGKRWAREELDRNYIATTDRKLGENHRVPQTQLPCTSCIVQTAVHIVKIADIDGDGKNEVLATISSPLELQQGMETTYLIVYRKRGGVWQREVIDHYSDREFRGIALGDVFHQGKNSIVIGLGSAQNKPGSVFVYKKENDQWKRSTVYADTKNTNLKSIDIDTDNAGGEHILISTGFPEVKSIIATWHYDRFAITQIGLLSRDLPIADASYNSMAALFDNQLSVINGGFIIFPKKKIGAEAATQGFLIIYTKSNNTWRADTIDRSSIWAMDLQ